VLVEARPHNVSVSCPLNAATYEETECILIVMAGTNLELTVMVNGNLHSKFYISGKLMLPFSLQVKSLKDVLYTYV
jgi:hypothetical protein